MSRTADTYTTPKRPLILFFDGRKILFKPSGRTPIMKSKTTRFRFQKKYIDNDNRKQSLCQKYIGTDSQLRKEKKPLPHESFEASREMLKEHKSWKTVDVGKDNVENPGHLLLPKRTVTVTLAINN